MAYITAVEAAKRLNKSEKTIRRWVKEGRLAGFNPQGHKNRLAIEEQNVERLAQELAEFEPQEQDQAEQDITPLLARIDALEQRLARLELAYGSVSIPTQQASSFASQSVIEPTAAAEQKMTRTRTASSSPAVTPSDIPPGSLQHYQLARRYGVNDRTFRDQLLKGLVPFITRQKPNRKEKEYWLSPDQQRAALQYWIEHDTPHSLPYELEQDSPAENSLSSQTTS